jgi:putative spermidine/putrescine transport system ATP-binding protein
MDEPLSALDKQLREHMQLEIRELHKQARPHGDLRHPRPVEALTMSDRVALFNARADRATRYAVEGIYDRPRTRFVAEFIGETNLFEAIVRSVANGIADGRSVNGSV